MQLRRDILLAVSFLALIAGPAAARTNHSAARSPSSTALVMAPAREALAPRWRPRAWSPPAPGTRQSQGLRVAIDPIDGTFSMPDAGETTQQVALGAGAPIPIRTRADGSRFAVLDDRFAEFAVATLGTDGKPRWSCVRGPRGVEQFMKLPVVVPGAALPAAPAPGTVWVEK